MVPRWPLNDQNAMRAYFNIPKADVDCVAKYSQEDKPLTPEKESQFRMQLLILRYTNVICDTCHKKPPTPGLVLTRCDKCYLAQYCSSVCRNVGWEHHRKRCCKPNGPLDTGPQQLAFVKVPEPPIANSNKVSLDGAKVEFPVTPAKNTETPIYEPMEYQVEDCEVD